MHTYIRTYTCKYAYTYAPILSYSARARTRRLAYAVLYTYHIRTYLIHTYIIHTFSYVPHTYLIRTLFVSDAVQEFLDEFSFLETKAAPPSAGCNGAILPLSVLLLSLYIHIYIYIYIYIIIIIIIIISSSSSSSSSSSIYVVQQYEYRFETITNYILVLEHRVL